MCKQEIKNDLQGQDDLQGIEHAEFNLNELDEMSEPRSGQRGANPRRATRRQERNVCHFFNFSYTVAIKDDEDNLMTWEAENSESKSRNKMR